MIIKGPHGTDTDKSAVSSDAIYAQVEFGQVGAIARGLLCVWSTSDTRASLGLDTRGLRVVIATAGYGAADQYRPAGFTIKNTPGTVGFSTQRGRIEVIQAYGFHPALQYNTGTDIIVGGPLISSILADGNVMGATASPINDISQALHVVGCSLEPVIVGAGTGTLAGFIRNII